MVSRRSVLATGVTGTLALSAGCLGFVMGNEPLAFEASKALPTAEALAETGYEEVDSDWERIEETVDVGVERDIRASFWMALFSKRVTLSADDLDLEDYDLDPEEFDLEEFENESDVDPEGFDLEEFENQSDVDPEDFDGDPGEYDLEDYEEYGNESDADPAEEDAEFENASDGDGEAYDLADYEDELADELEREAAMFAVISLPAMEVLGSVQNPLADVDTRELLEEFRGEFEGNVGDLREIEFEETIDLEILGESRSVDRFRATTTVESRGAEVDVDIDLRVTIFDNEADLLILLGGHPAELADEGTNVETLMASVEHPLEE